jgi:hypothetical protein
VLQLAHRDVPEAAAEADLVVDQQQRRVVTVSRSVNLFADTDDHFAK